jgi:hypothetical protein
MQDLLVELEVSIGRDPNLIPHLGCIQNQKTYLRLTQNLSKYLMKMRLNGWKRKIQEVAYQECLKIGKQESLVIKEGKRKQYLYFQEIM